MYSTSQNYKYQLDKSSKKHICPRCGKKTFVLYLDERGLPLSETVGKCDRKDNCAWHYSPRQYFQDNTTISNSTTRTMTPRNPPRPKPIPPDTIKPETFASTLKGYGNNSLMIFLHKAFDGIIGAQAVDRVAMSYAVGTARQFNGSPIFWQVDENGRIRTGKVMGYDPTTGKRIKQPRPQLAWVHSMMKDQLPNFRLQQCYFGSHRLINAERYAKGLTAKNKAFGLDIVINPAVWLFESEKAALIAAMALEWGGMGETVIPIASGGCEGFNPTDERKRDPYDAIRILKGRKVVIFPDQGKFDEWHGKAAALRGFASEVYISTCMERDLHPYMIECDFADGDALDDLILRYFADGKDVANLLITSYGYRGNYKIV